MPTGKIPFGAPVVRNTEEEFIPENVAQLFDGYVTEAGVSVKRPGLNTEFTLATYPVNGLFWWATQKKVVAVAGGACYVVSKSGSSYSTVTVTSAVPGTGRIYFAYDDDYFYLSDGGKIMYSDGTAASLTDIADADAPTACSHVSFLDGYIIGNNNNKRFYWSEIEDGLTWSALDFASAAGNPDNVIGQVVFNRQIFLIGEQTTEIWYNDGETPFSRGDGGFIERGCIAASSILKTKIGVFWLDNDRNLVLSKGGEPEILSLDYKTEFDSLQVVSDCETLFVEYKGRQFILLNFLSDNRTFAYCLSEKTWSEWGKYDSATGEYLAWKGRSYLWCPDWGLHLVGSNNSGAVYSMSDSYYDDEGEEIRFYKRTGFINHGSDSLKRSNRITLKIKRGYGDITATNAPKLMIRCRADGKSEWSNIREVSLGKAGDGVHVIDVFIRGAYYTRQYELSCTENIPVAFLDAEEDYTVLR